MHFTKDLSNSKKHLEKFYQLCESKTEQKGGNKT